MAPLDPHEREMWVSLREYVDVLLKEREVRLNERLEAQQAALAMANAVLEKRLTLLNELRGNVLSREEFEAKFTQLSQEVTNLRTETLDRASYGLSRDEYDAKHEGLVAEIGRVRDEVGTVRAEMTSRSGADQARARALATSIAVVGSISGFVFILVALLTHGFK